MATLFCCIGNGDIPIQVVEDKNNETVVIIKYKILSFIFQRDTEIDATMTQDNQIVTNHNESENNGDVLEGIKHPLENSWSFWMYTNIKKNTWEENLVKLTTFDTVEDYWCLYHHMKRPSELEFGQEYLVFKNNIRPTWEDKANKSGGRWLINFEKRPETLDQVWLIVILLMIGENFENSDVISGVVVNVRATSKIGIWISDWKNEKAILEIGKKLKNTLQLRQRINFHRHEMNKNLYII